MKTVADVWVLKSGDYFETFSKKAEAILSLTDQDFLDSFPENTVFTLQPGYVVVDFKIPKRPRHKDKPKKPQLKVGNK